MNHLVYNPYTRTLVPCTRRSLDAYGSVSVVPRVAYERATCFDARPYDERRRIFYRLGKQARRDPDTEWRLVDAEKRLREPRLIETAQRFFRQQLADVLRRLRRLDLYVLGPTVFKDPLVVSRLLPGQQEAERVEAVFTDSLRKVMATGFDVGALRIGVQGDALAFSADSRRARLTLSRSLEQIKGINQTTERRLLALVTAWQQTGDPVDALIDQIRAQYSQWSGGRAGRIGRTATVAMFEGGQLAAWEDAKIEQKAWISSRDSSVRDGPLFSHVVADGETVNLYDPFMQTGEALDHPGDPAGSPGNIIECRCTALPVMAGE